MNVFDEAKEVMKKAGCEKAFSFLRKEIDNRCCGIKTVIWG